MKSIKVFVGLAALLSVAIMMNQGFNDEASTEEKVLADSPHNLKGIETSPIADKTDIVKSKIQREIDETKTQVALTFDDGPSPSVTPRVLDILKAHGIHATFFVLGSQAEMYPEIIERMHEEGHEIGNHSWSHPQLTKLSKESIAKEINDTQNLIESITGVEPHYLRPPYGAYNETVKSSTDDEIVLWNIDPRDWESRNAKSVVSEVTKQMRDEGVVLMHDIYSSSAEALAQLFNVLPEDKYQFVQIDQIKSSLQK